jgi:hypothetical protein
MALYDLIRVATATTGTGVLTLGPAVDGGRSFASIPDGTEISYAIADEVAGVTYREVGRGVKSGVTLTRTMTSSTTGTTLTLSGNATVGVVALAADIDAAQSALEVIDAGTFN